MTTRPRALSLGIAGLVGLVVGLVWWPVYRFPYIRDDWFTLSQVHQMSGEALLRFLAFPDQQWFRPLGTAYLWINYQWFGLESAGFHTFDLLLQAFASLLVVAIARRLGVDTVASCAAGILYAAAVVVHMDMLLWASGIYDLGGVAFFLLSLWLFLDGRHGFALAAFVIALLFKEAVVVLPGILLAWTLLAGKPGRWQERIIRAARTLWGFALVTAAYLVYVLATRGVPFQRPQEHPYRMSADGDHLWQNFLHYATWSLEAIAPAFPDFFEQHAMVIGALVLAIAAAALGISAARARLTATPGPWTPSLRRFFFLACWWLIALLPPLLLSNHLYRYYLAYALPAFLIAVCQWALGTTTHLLGSRRRAEGLLGIATAACILVSSLYFWNRSGEAANQQYTHGTNSLIAQAATVDGVRSGLARLVPALPPGSNLVFIGLQPWHFGYRSGPRLWYADPTLQVYALGELASDATGFYHAAAARPRYLDPERTHFFTLRQGTLVPAEPPPNP